MLKNSTSATKQALMEDQSSLKSPKLTFKSPNSPIFTSQKLFPNFASKPFIDTTDYVLNSPTSILDTKPFSPIFKPPNPQILENTKPGPKKVGLGIVDDLSDEMPESKFPEPISEKVIFGSKLKIQIPQFISPVQSPRDYGIKTRVVFSPCSVERKSLSTPLSPGEMELLEEYTCVISRGPNPKTTHIFDDCVVESCRGVGVFGEKQGNKNRAMSYPSESFLSFCFTCKKSLGNGDDIYMYRGEKGFCSSECRLKEMMLEEKMGKNVI